MGLHWRQGRGLAGRIRAWRGHRRAKVLIINEFEPYAELISEALRRAGYRPRSSHPRDALRLVAEGLYDVVVSGLILPYLTGLELLTAVKASSPQTRVILLTGDPTGKPARDAIEGGAFAVLGKRAMDELTAAVNQACAHGAATRESALDVTPVPVRVP